MLQLRLLFLQIGVCSLPFHSILVQYMVRCPFSLSRLVRVTNTGQVVYKAEKQACQAFPDPHADDLKAGANRNFQILSPLDFLAPPPPQTGHAAPTIALLWCPAEGFACDSLLWLVLEQVAWYAQEGGS